MCNEAFGNSIAATVPKTKYPKKRKERNLIFPLKIYTFSSKDLPKIPITLIKPRLDFTYHIIK